MITCLEDYKMHSSTDTSKNIPTSTVQNTLGYDTGLVPKPASFRALIFRVHAVRLTKL